MYIKQVNIWAYNFLYALSNIFRNKKTYLMYKDSIICRDFHVYGNLIVKEGVTLKVYGNVVLRVDGMAFLYGEIK